MAATGIDHLAFSGHELYAGSWRERLEAGPPLLRGGVRRGARHARRRGLGGLPERHEAGSPDVVGVVALAAACRRLRGLGMDAVAAHERELAARLEAA